MLSCIAVQGAATTTTTTTTTELWLLDITGKMQLQLPVPAASLIRLKPVSQRKLDG